MLPADGPFATMTIEDMKVFDQMQAKKFFMQTRYLKFLWQASLLFL